MKVLERICDLCAGPIAKDEKYAVLHVPIDQKPKPTSEQPTGFFGMVLTFPNEADTKLYDVCLPCVRLLMEYAKAHAEALR